MARVRTQVFTDFTAADKAKLDAASRHPKQECRLATTATLPACSYTNGTGGVGARLTGTVNNPLADQDGVTLAVDERLLVKNEAAQETNGIYRLVQAGTADPGGTPFILERTTDFDSSTDIVPNSTVWVKDGTAIVGNRDTEWVLNINAAPTVGTTALPWIQTYGSTLTTETTVKRVAVDAGVDRVTNAAIETAFATTAGIAAGTLAVGDELEIAVGLRVASVNGADTLALGVRLGGVAGVAVLAVPATAHAAADYVRLTVTATVATVGAGGSVHRAGRVQQTVAAVPQEFGDVEFDLACATNVARDVTVTATWSNANAANQVDLRDFEVKILRTLS